jgi:hypothetical protein
MLYMINSTSSHVWAVSFLLGRRNNTLTFILMDRSS